MAELRVKGTGTLKLFENDNTSSVTIASPASLSADKTITLPDADVTLVSGTMNDATALSGNIPVSNLNSGTSASSSTFWRGDGTWVAPSGGTALTGSTDNTVTTVTGADAIQGETNFIYDGTIVGCGADGANADLGVGLHIKTADSGASADSNADELIVENGTAAGDAGINILSATDGTGRISFGDSGDSDIGFLRYNHDNGRMWMINNGGDTNYAFGMDSNVTTTTKFRLQIFSDGAESSRHRMIGFDNSSQGRGYIESGDGDSTAPRFAAGSDRRLKENITTYTGGYDKIKAIPVKQWDEKYSSKNKGVKGWVADELETVFPDAVSGTANTTKNVTNAILDKDGRLVEEDTTEARLKTMQSIGKMPNCTFASSATVPVYQYSSPLWFFPDVVQALQASITKIETLEAKVTALENA